MLGIQKNQFNNNKIPNKTSWVISTERPTPTSNGLKNDFKPFKIGVKIPLKKSKALLN